jgi:hypothetical protein
MPKSRIKSPGIKNVFRVSVRGKSVPVTVYKLHGVKDVFGYDSKRSMGTFFVCRDKEVQKIDQILDFSKDKNGFHLFVKGDASVGKSRLKDEIYRLSIKKGILLWEDFCSGFEINTLYFLWKSLI